MVEIMTLELPAIPTFFHDSNVLPERLFNNWEKQKKHHKDVLQRVTMLQK